LTRPICNHTQPSTSILLEIFIYIKKMSTAMLMKKLLEIEASCSPQRKLREQEEREQNLDDFTIEKRRMAEFVREIRADIKERDKLYQDSPNDRTKAVTKGAEIRKKLKDATERADHLEKMYKSKHKKLKQKQKIPGVEVSVEKKEKDENRKAVVDLMWEHLKELERQEKNVLHREIESLSESDGSRDVGGVGGIAEMDDPRFELLRKNDREIDDMLDVTLAGVRRLKQLSLEQQVLTVETTELIETIQNMTDLTLGNLESVNGQLKKTIQAVRSTSNCCCDIILCMLILGIAVAIYFVATKKT